MRFVLLVSKRCRGNARNWRSALLCGKACVWMVALAVGVYAQTSINLATQGRNADFSSFSFTRPMSVGNAVPATCQVGQLFFDSATFPGANIFGCTAENVWTNFYVPPVIVIGQTVSMPLTCSPGALYFATDQPAGQQIYTCSAINVWTQQELVGGSGARAVVNGALDIVTSVVPRLGAANTFTGYNSFNAIQLQGTASDPGCKSSSDIGKIWINTASSSNTVYEVCLASAGTIKWISK